MAIANLARLAVGHLDLPRAAGRWTSVLWFRVRRYFPLKLIGTTLWTWAFFVGYFHLLRHPNGAVTIVPTTALDRMIAFHPHWLIPYVSLWLYVGIAPGLQLRFLQLLAYGFWTGLLLLVGLGLFWLWPTAVPPAVFDPQGFPGFELMRGIDAAGNACPSMHVAIALHTAIWIEFQFVQIGVPVWLRLGNVVWFAAIVVSTMALKQHVLVDVVGGAALGMAFAGASLRWRPR